jgi:hypothetical protein
MRNRVVCRGTRLPFSLQITDLTRGVGGQGLRRGGAAA